MELTQEQAIQLVDNIGLTLGLERHTDTMGCSYYAISNDTVVRISDHSTYLQTWVDNGTSSKPNLFSIVIEVNPSKPNPNINSDTLFKVIEYKHRLRSLLNGEEYLELINAIKGAIGNGGQFSNPFGVKKKLLCSKYSPKTDGENEQPIKESKTNKNMKTKKRTITESQLRNIIAESVKKILNENEYRPQPKLKLYHALTPESLCKEIENIGNELAEKGQRTLSRQQYQDIIYPICCKLWHLHDYAGQDLADGINPELMDLPQDYYKD